MELDPNNPVVRLCALGMQAEAEGRPRDALARFEEAWGASRDDFEACVAAHYVARHQDSPDATLRWNEEALRRAGLVGDDRVRPFYPSLMLCVGQSHETLGNADEARRWYGLAAERVGDLPDTPYGAWVRSAVRRVTSSSPGSGAAETGGQPAT